LTSTTPPQAGHDGLHLRGVTVRFGGLTALHDVSVSVAPGRILGVIGPNGAGKTTLFNVVCGFVKPVAGEMAWAGRPHHPRPHRLADSGIGRTLQSIGLFSGLTVLENVMVGATRTARAGFSSALFGLPRSDRDERRLREAALSYLALLRVDQYAHELPTPLPHAIQKKVALARALAAQPRLLLLDEPAASLSAEEIDELAGVIRQIPASADQPCAVMLVEHHMDLVMSVCEEITVLDFGQVIAHGGPADIRASRAVTDAYLGTAAPVTPSQGGAPVSGAVVTP
jgi:branched-chain amino acid transport system ATP-binding protein